MGVPALFRWLSNKYPRIIGTVVEEKPLVIDDIAIPVDFSKPNPNGVEIDNLYLDMNGIIHPCCHPEDKEAPKTEDDMYIAIFEYIDRIMSIIRPRKILYMAVDGVAPRAKMNQQRSRRFRAAQEAQIDAEKEVEIRAQLAETGLPLADALANTDKFDSNCITPGTPFMANLVVALRYYITQRLHTEPGWRNIKVLLSDASVPGEGEHKIMDFIRRQRCEPGYDPNTRHVMYGLDADLIMLGLATHEPHFTILREDIWGQEKEIAQRGLCHNCGKPGHNKADCKSPKNTQILKSDDDGKKPYVFLHVSILREYLEGELCFDERVVGFPFQLENAIDDWVFLCFFVGNDFLPHLPCLEIREGAIDMLIDIYKRNLPKMKGYLTDCGHVNMARVQHIFNDLGAAEDEIFRRRKQNHDQMEMNKKRREKINSLRNEGYSSSEISGIMANFMADLEQQNAQAQFERVHSEPTKLADTSNKNLVKHRNQTMDLESIAQPIARRQVKSISSNKAAANNLRKQLLSAGEPCSPKAIPVTLNEEEKSVTVSEGGVDHSPFPVIETSNPLSSIPPSIIITEDVVMTDSTIDTSLPTAEAPLTPKAGSKRSISEAGLDDEDAQLEPELKRAEVGTDIVPLAEDDDDIDSTMGTPVPHAKSPVEPVQPELLISKDVELHVEGWRTRYYEAKIGEYSDDLRKRLAHDYMEGLAWVLHYYFLGCPSWKWFYPHHYAPFASDFTDLESLDIKFELGTPFKPIEQLMGVFPAASRKHIPSVFHDLMTDSRSEIIDFYPTEFQIDLNGKRHAWQGVALLPFIDEKRLLDAVTPRYAQLSEEDQYLNTLGYEIMMISHLHPLFGDFAHAYRPSGESIKLNIQVGQVAGTILPDPVGCKPGQSMKSPFPNHLDSQRDIKNVKSISVAFSHPEYSWADFHRTKHLLPGLQLPKRTLTWGDITFAFNRHRARSKHILADKLTGDRLVKPRSIPSGSSDQNGGSSYSTRQSYPGPNRDSYSPRGDHSSRSRYSDDRSHYHHRDSRDSRDSRDNRDSSRYGNSRSYQQHPHAPQYGGYPPHAPSQAQAQAPSNPYAFPGTIPGAPPAGFSMPLPPPPGANPAVASQYAQMMQLQMHIQMQMAQFQQQHGSGTRVVGNPVDSIVPSSAVPQHQHQQGQPPRPNMAWNRNLQRGNSK